MSKLDDFINYLEEQAANHSIYVWGAQGQADITEEWIRNRERDTGGYSASLSYADSAVAFWREQIAAGYESVLRAFDCSGLGVYWLLKNGLFKTDTTAHGMYGKCAKTDKPSRGCWVFRWNGAKTRMSHIGYCVSDTEVIHAKGRKYGVVKEPYSSSYWHAVGIPNVFADDIGKPAVVESPDAEIPSEEADYLVVVVGGTVRVRQGESALTPKLFTAKRGDTFPLVREADGGWYKIDTVFGTGYISSKAKYTKLTEA